MRERRGWFSCDKGTCIILMVLVFIVIMHVIALDYNPAIVSSLIFFMRELIL